MMSGHDANPIFFNRKNKDWTFRALSTLTSLRRITSHFCLSPPPFLKVDVICVSPLIKKLNEFNFINAQPLGPFLYRK